MWVHRLTDSFRNQDYRQFWTGSMVTILAFRMQDVVLGWQMLEATDSAFWVGVVAFAYGLPLLIWSPITGFLADRMERQRIVAVALGTASVTSAALAVLTTTGKVLPWHVVLVSFLLGSTFTLYAPARLALLPSLVPAEMLVSASTIEYSSTRLMGFLGPALAGALVDLAGIPSALVVQVLFLGFAAFLFLVTGRDVEQPMEDKARGGSMWHGFGEVAAYLRRDRPLLSLLVLGLVMVPFGMAHKRLMPVFARDVLSVGASGLGLMVGVSSLGAGLAGFAVAAVGDVFRKGRALLVSSVVFGAGLVLFAFSRSLELATGLLLVVGLFAGVYLTLSNLLFQARSPNAVRGRVLSVWGMVWGMLPFASLAMGAAAEWIGVATAMGVCGAICVVFGLGMALADSHLQRL